MRPTRLSRGGALAALLVVPSACATGHGGAISPSSAPSTAASGPAASPSNGCPVRRHAPDNGRPGPAVQLTWSARTYRVRAGGELPAELGIHNTSRAPVSLTLILDPTFKQYLLRPGERDPVNFPSGGYAISLPPAERVERRIAPGGTLTLPIVFGTTGCRASLPAGTYLAEPAVVVDDPAAGPGYWFASPRTVTVTAAQ